MAATRKDQTDHERDMERLAVRLVQANQRDTAITDADPRNGKQGGKKNR